MGPGIVGTNTRLGFSGMEVGPILDAAHALGGVPIACLRVSFADGRDAPRRALAPQRDRAAPRDARPRAGRGARARRPEQAVGLRDDLVAAGIDRAPRPGRRRRRPTCWRCSRATACAIASMGRPAADDPALFQAAAAAGVLAADASGAPQRSGGG